jgi:hypothetical protein
MKARKTHPTIERLNELFSLDRETGILTRRLKTQWTKPGDIAGTKTKDYLVTRVDGKTTKVHLIVFAMVNGEWPKTQVDHEDTIKTNNRPVNLRLASHEQNQQNKKANTNNTAGEKGVSWNSRTKKWRVDIQANGIRRYLGCFEDVEFAGLVYASAADRLHGRFARTQ